jgi:hypothetical protein
MAVFSRFSLALSICAGLAATALASACTTNVIEEQHAAPAMGADGGTDDEGGTVDPGGNDAGKDSSASTFVFKAAPDGTFATAETAGGSVVKTPKIVPIVFSVDPSKATIDQFVTKLATSTYWGAISSEYGVGPLTAMPSIVVSETAPGTISDQQIASWLQQKFSTDAAQFGTPDSNTLYAIYYPPNTTVTQGGGSGCDTFGGYHYETSAGGKPISYAVIPRCATFGGFSGDEVITYASSHEFLEWATDPFPQSRPAYMFVDDDHAVWSKIFLGELGDLCTQMGDVSALPADLGFRVQRTWSNVAAAAGHHPCAPAGKVPYFTAYPSKPEEISVTDIYGRNIMTTGYQVAVGAKKTVELTMYSDADLSEWQIQVIDLSQLTAGGAPPEFVYTLDKAKGVNGDKIQLTIAGLNPADKGQGFMVVTQHGNDLNLFPVWLTN